MLEERTMIFRLKTYPQDTSGPGFIRRNDTAAPSHATRLGERTNILSCKRAVQQVLTHCWALIPGAALCLSANHSALSCLLLLALFIFLHTLKGGHCYLPEISAMKGRGLRLPTFCSWQNPSCRMQHVHLPCSAKQDWLCMHLALSPQSTWNNMRVVLEPCGVIAWNTGCLWCARGIGRRCVLVFEGAKLDEILSEDCVQRQTWCSVLHVAFWKRPWCEVLGSSPENR